MPMDDQPAALANINSKVLDDRMLRSILEPDIFTAFSACRADGDPMAKAHANSLADSIRKWAQSKGCIGYSHWFSPIRGPLHGEKLETFMDINYATGELIVNLSGAELFQTETDGSSFPNGGLRVTHEAAAYIGWDMQSPPFVNGTTLYIPSAFVTWSGEALDEKTPLLRSSDAVNKQALRMLRHLGDQATQRVVANVGWEQEFFVVTREDYLARPDLVATGRTLFGQEPLRGQQQSTNYFGRMPVRIREYLEEARERMWAMGISIDCVHNEVAPAQYELSPIFSLVNLAADTNVLAMDVLRDLAFERDLTVLFHEKPFAGINGNGKHNNWGLNTDTGSNLFVPGKNADENRRFVVFLAALLHGVNKHGDLLRCGVSTAGNDHRLGAQEAPPAIITLCLGKLLEAHLKQISEGAKLTGYGEQDKLIHVSASVADIKGNLEDRNRTASFPWCGNRFEFRAVGGNQHIAFPLAIVNTIMADGLKQMCDRIDTGAGLDQVVRETLKENQGALFSGDGYSSALFEHAEQHNLFHIKTSPEAYQRLTAPKNLKMFSEQGVFSEAEAVARQNVLLETLATEIQIEARTLISIMSTLIVPAALDDVATIVASGFKSRAFVARPQLVQNLLDQLDQLTDAFAGAVSENPLEAAEYAQTTLKPALLAARDTIDALEAVVDARLWPVPTYDELLHGHL
jgi:glutamine synthetase